MGVNLLSAHTLVLETQPDVHSAVARCRCRLRPGRGAAALGGNWGIWEGNGTEAGCVRGDEKEKREGK